MRKLVCLIAVVAVSACDTDRIAGPVAHAAEVVNAPAPPAATVPQVIVCRGARPFRMPGPLFIVDGEIARDSAGPSALAAPGAQVKILRGSEATTLYGSRAAEGVVIITTKSVVR